jgi:hypothetical protein
MYPMSNTLCECLSEQKNWAETLPAEVEASPASSITSGGKDQVAMLALAL